MPRRLRREAGHRTDSATPRRRPLTAGRSRSASATRPCRFRPRSSTHPRPRPGPRLRSSYCLSVLASPCPSSRREGGQPRPRVFASRRLGCPSRRCRRPPHRMRSGPSTRAAGEPSPFEFPNDTPRPALVSLGFITDAASGSPPRRRPGEVRVPTAANACPRSGSRRSAPPEPVGGGRGAGRGDGDLGGAARTGAPFHCEPGDSPSSTRRRAPRQVARQRGAAG